jgi:antitoxin (DNA-binding transcriptional repressor) of toxin-antitoxin stability system
MEWVARTGEPIEVTKRGKPLVRLIPAKPARARARSIFGAARDTILYLAPDDELFATVARWHAQR